MENIQFIDVISPQSPWDFFLYVIMFFQFILLFILFATESLRDTLMIAAVVIAAVMDKAYLFGYIECGATNLTAAVDSHSKYAFGTMAARMVMFAFPLILVTQTKVKAARPLAIILAILSMIYVGARWAFQQRTGGWGGRGACFAEDFNHSHEQYLYAHAGMLILTHWLLDEKRLGHYFKKP